LYRGKITAEAMISRLGAKKGVNNLWLMTPELAMNVGSGPKAESFVTHMTELYDTDQTFQDDTRLHGAHKILNPCINWAAGTTLDWLLRSVGKQDILGGFFARICVVPGARSATRYPKPILPPDARQVNEWLTGYLAHLTQVAGEFTWDPDADAYHDWWYTNRREPENPLLWHYYEHGDNLVHKLGMVLALSDGYSLVGSYDHMVNAVALYEWLWRELPGVLEFAHRTPEVERLEMVADAISAVPFIDHVRLLRRMTSRGVTRDQLQAIINTLRERGDVVIKNIGPGRSYQWVR
jgi:hypothetical protein